MDPNIELFLMSVAMFVGCYLAGKLPLVLQSRESKNQLMSVFGAGMLVGTAFTVIIPEGIRTLYMTCDQEATSLPTQQRQDSGGVVAAEAGTLHHHSEHQHKDNEFIIAISLLLGFLFMLVVDKCANSHHGGGGRADVEGSSPASAGSRKVFTATLGLVVHAAADGIALGAAAASHHSDVEFIVFFAIMLHKAPTAFGLTSFLVREGHDARRINKLLFVFAAAAPLGAFVIYALISLSGSESVSNSANTSIAMLFSAGTFLFVATVHIIPEIMSSSSGGGSTGGGASGGGGLLVPSSSGETDSHLSWGQLFTMVVGAFVPLIFSLGHHH